MIKTTETIAVERTCYIAMDGEKFTDENACQTYEASALCVLNKKYKPLVIQSVDSSKLFISDNCDSIIDIVKISNENDVDLILQMSAIFDNDWQIDRQEKILSKALEEGSGIVLIDRGNNNDDFYVITSKDALLDSINNLTEENSVFD